MVDPNRKINRLNSTDIHVLEEYEEEFSERFTKNDKEFMEVFEKISEPPPIIEPWHSRNQNWHHHRGGGRRGGGRRTFNHPYHRGGGNYNRSNYNNPGASGSHHYTQNRSHSNSYQP